MSIHLCQAGLNKIFADHSEVPALRREFEHLFINPSRLCFFCMAAGGTGSISLVITMQTLEYTDVCTNICSVLQHTATHCNTLQHTATHCNTLQHTTDVCTNICSVLQHTATHCNTLQHTTDVCTNICIMRNNICLICDIRHHRVSTSDVVNLVCKTQTSKHKQVNTNK